ncbi:MAG: hypothetical protein ACI4WY_01280 [Anaerovoracaceae bacterium]
MAELFETLMLICFGCSWPMNLAKSIRSKTAKGKSVMFQYAIIIGYICGICSKFAGGNINYVLALYFLNLFMVSVDTCLYYRNRKLDQLRDAGKLAA